MAQSNPFDQFDAFNPPGGALPSPPEKPAPPTALQLRDQELQEAAARRAELEWNATHLPDGTPKPKAAGSKADDPKIQAKLANLESLTGQINRVQQLYNSNLRDEALPLLSSLWEYLPTPANRQFDSAAAGMAEQGLAAFRVPGVGAQSDTELRQFVDANKPSAADADLSIEEKLRQLRARVQATREQMGLPPAEWTGLNEEEADEPLPAATTAGNGVSLPPGGTPGGPSFSPGDPSYVPATGDKRLVADPETQATVDQMLRDGESYAAINDYAINRGMAPINRQEYAAARRAIKLGQPVTINAQKYEPVTTYEKGVTALGDNPVGAYALGAGQFLTGNTLDNLPGVDSERARLALGINETKHPTATAIGQISGGVMAGLTGEAGLARLGMSSGIMRGALAESFMGGANGAGAADLPSESRLGSGLVGSVSGLAGAVGGYGVARGLQKGVGALYSPVSRSLGRDPDVASRQVATALKDDGLTPRDAAARISEAQARGSPMAIADLGENSREMLASVGRAKGESRAKAQTFAKERQAEQLERIGATVRRELGPTANIREAGEQLMAGAKTQAGPLYTEAFDAPGAGAIAPKLETLLNRPSARRAMTRAQRISAEEGVDPTALGFDLNAQGEVVLTRVPSWQTLHYIKLGMDDVIEEYRDTTTGRLKLDTEGNAINGTLRAMLKMIDETNPAYAAARAAYAGPARMKSAMEKGVGIMSRDPDDILANLRDLSDGEVEMYRLGARKGVMNLLEGKGDYADKVNALIGTPKKRLALSRVFGNTNGFGRLQEVLGDEKAMGETYRAVSTGSQTAGRMAFDAGAHETAKTAVEIGQAAKTGGLTGAAVAAWLRLSEAAKLGVGAAGDAARSQMADILTAATPDQLRDLARQLQRPAARQRLQARAQRKIAGRIGHVTGGTAGVSGVNAYSED